MSITIWHNPRCSKSRQTLELLRSKGIEPAIREYLKQPPSKAEVEALIAQVGGDPAELIRDGETGTLFAPDDPQACAAALGIQASVAELGDPVEEVARVLVHLPALHRVALVRQYVVGPQSCRWCCPLHDGPPERGVNTLRRLDTGAERGMGDL